MTVAIAEQTRRSVWGNRGFVLYWTAGTVSMAGSSVTAIVIPLVCATLLDATPTQMSVLFAVGIAAPLLLQVAAGSWADRTSRQRAAMCTADFAAGVAMASIPVLWYMDRLTYASVIVVMALVASLGVLRVAVSIPVLLKVVPHQQLVDANGLMNSSRSAMEVAGKGVAGGLLAVMAAPVVLIVDAVSFLVASALAARVPVHSSEAPSALLGEDSSSTRFGEVLRSLAQRRDLWSLILIALVNGVTEAVLILYCLRTLELSPALVAALFALGAAGGISGGLVVGRVVARGGSRLAVVLGLSATIASLAPLPFVGPGTSAVAAVIGFEFLGALGGTIAVAAAFSDIQMSAPPDAVGRTMAVTDNALQLATLVGIGLGGATAELYGLRNSVVVALVLVAIAGLPLAIACLRSTRSA